MRSLGFLGVLVWTTTVSAQPAAVPLAPPGMTVPAPAPAAAAPAGESEVVNYRWQIAAADAASIALVLSQSRSVSTAGAFVYLLGGPVIHALNGEGNRTAGSLALRITLPLVGALAGAKLFDRRTSCAGDDIDCYSDDLAGAFVGFGVGALGAMIIDTALVARPHVVHKEPQRAAQTWVPQITVTPHQKTVGVLARF